MYVYVCVRVPAHLIMCNTAHYTCLCIFMACCVHVRVGGYVWVARGYLSSFFSPRQINFNPSMRATEFNKKLVDDTLKGNLRVFLYICITHFMLISYSSAPVIAHTHYTHMHLHIHFLTRVPRSVVLSEDCSANTGCGWELIHAEKTDFSSDDLN